MTRTAQIHGVYLSDTLDLESLYGDALKADDVVLHRPEAVTDAEEILFAICWEPGPSVFSNYPNLAMAMSIGAGVDSLLAHPQLQPGVTIARVRDPHQAKLMAGFAVHEVLHYERNFGPMMESASQAQWRPVLMRAPSEAVVAVLGHGTMGRAVAEALAALGFTVRVAARSDPKDPISGVSYLAGPLSAIEAASGADYLVNVLPLTSSTENVLDRHLFSKLNHGARLIQIGRGEHLVEADMLEALDAGRLAGATLDVFRTEPLPPDHRFWSDQRLRITPHIASDSIPEVVAQQVIESARQLRDTEPIELAISRSAGY